MVVEDCLSLETAMESEDFAGVILDEPSPDILPNLSELNGQLNFSKTFVYAGPLPAWHTLNQIPQIMVAPGAHETAVESERCEFGELRGEEDWRFCPCDECRLRQKFVSHPHASSRAAPD